MTTSGDTTTSSTSNDLLSLLPPRVFCSLLCPYLSLSSFAVAAPGLPASPCWPSTAAPRVPRRRQPGAFFTFARGCRTVHDGVHASLPLLSLHSQQHSRHSKLDVASLSTRHAAWLQDQLYPVCLLPPLFLRSSPRDTLSSIWSTSHLCLTLSHPSWCQIDESHSENRSAAQFDARRQATWRRLLGGLRYDATIQPALVPAKVVARNDREASLQMDGWDQDLQPCFYPQVTDPLCTILYEEWLSQAATPPTMNDPSRSSPMSTVDYSYILPLAALPHLHSLHLDLVLHDEINSSAILTETPFAHLYSLVPSLTSLTLRGAWEPDDETGTQYATVDLQLILTSLSRLRHLTLKALPLYHVDYLPLVMDSSTGATEC